MQPESEGEFTWLLPSRKQEKGRSQINSPSFLPSSLSSGEGLFAKQKGCCASSWLVKQGQHANASCCVGLHMSLHLFFLHSQHPGFVP